MITQPEIRDTRFDVRIPEPNNLPIMIARGLFERYVQPIEHVTFEQRMAEYSYELYGFVVSNSNVFAMGRLDLDAGRYLWRVDTAVGQMSELLKHMPFELPWIAFQRRAKKDHSIRVVPTSRLRYFSSRLSNHDSRITDPNP